MKNKPRHHAALILLLTPVLLIITAVTSSAQKTNKLEIEYWREVLRTVQRELKENYYDPTFNGIDVDARFRVADAKMKNAESMDDLQDIVPVLAYAASLAGVELDPKKAGGLFPSRWRTK